MNDSSSRPLALDLLDRYLANECSPAEIQTVERWLAADPDNQKILHGMRELQLVQGALSPAQIDAAWKDFTLTWLDAPVQQPVALSRKRMLRAPARFTRFSWRGFIAASALALVAAGIGGAFVTKWSTTYTPAQSSALRTFSTSKGQRATLQLVDGSQVTLGPESRIDIASDFSSGLRKIQVSGSAFFEVTHDPVSPFVVQSADAIVHVIGTAFVVERYEQDTSVRVVVSQGKVAVRNNAPELGNKGGEPTILTQGEAAEVITGQHTVVRRRADLDTELAWLGGELRFRQTPLSEVIRVLERWYNVSIHFTDTSFTTQRITAAFGREGITEVLTQIANASGVRCQYRDSVTIVCKPR
jgi:transmembrane sensor